MCSCSKRFCIVCQCRVAHQHEGSQCDRCPYEDHAQLWRAQKQPTKAVCSRRRLHTLVWSPHLEHGSSKASLHSPGAVSPPTSLPACDRRPAACLLRGHVCPCRHTTAGPSCGRASATLRPPPRGRRGRGTLSKKDMLDQFLDSLVSSWSHKK
uniref:RING-type domain-containing protein n=1 Tax=Trichogramma kaykai TaxID=54128 RepID=A0ABD2WL50_9HYME